MQDTQPSLSWTQIAFGIVASFIGGGGAYKLFNIWLNRKKPAAEITETEARADKTRAEARKIGAEADVQFNTIIERLHARIDQMQSGVDEIRAERNEYKMRCDLQQIELKLRDSDIKKLKGLLDANGIQMNT
jgi:uncharacterized coiled-coil DUF342 family protein